VKVVKRKKWKTAMKKRYCTIGLGCLFCLGMLSPLWACSPTIDPQADHDSKQTEAAMNLAHKTETDTPAIPPVDMSAPALVETASFGLG
jgi:hypothetical protein